MLSALLMMALAAEPALQEASSGDAFVRRVAGDWRVLGPASQAHTAHMIRLTLRALPPTQEDFAAARLTDEQARQVLEARGRLQSAPDSVEVIGLRQDAARLSAARASFDGNALTLTFGPDEQDATFTVLSSEGIRTVIRVDGPEGPQEMLVTSVDANTLMLGPMGSEPLVLYRLTAP